MTADAIHVTVELPPITRTQLALYGGASGDHNPIHIDIDFAKKAAFPDVFAHGMLVMGLAGRVVTQAVPLARLKSNPSTSSTASDVTVSTGSLIVIRSAI